MENTKVTVTEKEVPAVPTTTDTTVTVETTETTETPVEPAPKPEFAGEADVKQD